MRRGFTLVELMVVVAIISLLAAIAIPRWISMTERSKQTEAKVNLRGIFASERMYFQEHGGYSNDFVAIGFSPDRGNRFAYYLNYPAATTQLRNAAKLTVGTTNDSIGADQFAWPQITAQPIELASDGTLTFANNLIPAGSITYATTGVKGQLLARAYGRVASGRGSTTTSYDSWFISTADSTITSGCKASNGRKIPPGTPGPTYDQAACQ